MSNNNLKLTPKQEAFCQAYVRLGNKTAAYREAYSTENMKPETINRKAFDLFNKGNIRASISELEKELKERNQIDIDELITALSQMVRFDPIDLFNPDGTVKDIDRIPIDARKMISGFEVTEIYSGSGKNKKLVGNLKKIKIKSLDPFDKLLRFLGGYKKDHEQAESITIVWHEQKTYEQPKE
ncbi:MAG: terminase small subunit [Chitinophagaceae bacterium]|nr:terminase small subunit [Chitinophagaceae bacterium]